MTEPEKIVVRFAPSPTGSLHIGSARTALFNFLFARKTGGKFLLRIEDTDKTRSTKEAEQTILSGLKTLNIDWDEEIVYQSANSQIHVEAAKKMIENGFAYYAYDTGEELNAKREEAAKNGKLYKYDGKWRNQNLEIPKDVKPVIRLKVPEGKTIVHDIIKGIVEFDNKDLDDLILVRSDSTPTYMLAVVVDDINMNITHIIRGDDHLSNTPKQCLIYKALGRDVPKFAHIPMILDPSGKKLSKRRFAASVEQYLDLGYLPESIVNYLLHLGASGCYNRDITILADAIKEFDLTKLGVSPSRFDILKLKDINRYYINNLFDDELINYIKNSFLKLHNIALTEKDIQKINLLILELKKYPLINDMIAALLPIISNQYSTEELQNINDFKSILVKFKNFYLSLGHSFSKDDLTIFLNENSLHIKEFGKILRIALVGAKDSFSLVNLVNCFDKEELTLRLNKAIS
jgi:glutamyl-tRNA synthetase